MANGQAVEVKGTNPVSGGVINTIVGTGLGLATAGYNDRRQERLNRKLQAQQLDAAKQMAKYNQQMGLETWEKTGYGAQRRQLQDAGLNVGLMYGQAGGQGTTQTAPGQYPGGGANPVGNEIGMGIQSALSMAMLKAQIENTQADTKLKETEAGKKAGVDTQQAEAETGLTLQKTENEKINNALLQYQEKIAQVETRIKQNTEENAVLAIKQANQQAQEDITAQRIQNKISRSSADEIIKQLNTASQEQALRIEAQKLGLIKTTAETQQVEQSIKKAITEINMMVQTNMREWDKMSQKDKEIAIEKKIMEIQQQNADFNTSTPNQLRQWTNLIMSIIPIANLGAGN